MKKTSNCEVIFSSQDLVDEIYKGNLEKISLAKIDPNDLDYMSYIEFIEENKLEDWPVPDPYFGEIRNLKEFDSYMQTRWYMSENYKSFNIEDYLYSLCNSDTEKNRVTCELELYKKHNLLTLLRFLKFLIDFMRDHNILWGVGRGSSVSSYCLYLLGIHKVDSIKYDLDIREFLK